MNKLANIDVVFHIGQHKSGTTYLQNRFQKITKSCRKNIIYYSQKLVFCNPLITQADQRPPQDIRE